jgi:catechol 2,3-dioxygenase-like lactoylglutathione lyase family enzyme
VIDFDHVALAAPDVQPIVDLLVGELGGTALFGKEPPDFRWVLVRVGDGEAGMNLELLESTGDESSFLRRFLERRGPGPHHLTFKTDDLEKLIARVREAGYELVDVSLDDPEWREAFLRPRDAHGTIVQLASSTLERPPMAEMLREPAARLTQYARGAGPSRVWWREPPRGGETVRLERVVLRTPALEDALRLYRDLLGGEPVGEDELRWPGGRLRLERGDDAGIVALEAGGPERDDLSLAGLPLRIVRP